MMTCPFCKSRNIDGDADTNSAACMDCGAEQDARGTWRDRVYMDKMLERGVKNG